MSKLRETPHIYADRLSKLSAEERGELRAILTSKVFIKLCRIADCMKPSPHCKNGGSGDRDEFSDARANARLGELRGWELHAAAQWAAIQEPAVIKTAAADIFPDSGAIDADWGKVP
jgi:hypothetical protein